MYRPAELTRRQLLRKASPLISSVTGIHVTSRPKPLCPLSFPAQSGRLCHYPKRTGNFRGFVSVVYRGYQLKVLRRSVACSYSEQMMLHSPLQAILSTGFLSCAASDLCGISFSKWQERCPTMMFWMQWPTG